VIVVEYKDFLNHVGDTIDTPATIGRRNIGDKVIIMGECMGVLPAFTGIGYLLVGNDKKILDNDDVIYIEIDRDNNIFKAVKTGLITTLAHKILAIRGFIKDIRKLNDKREYLIKPSHPIRIFVEKD
jgi:hypothetical protein